MEILWRSIGGLIAIMGFGVVLNVPGRFLFWAGLDGALGWCIYLLTEAYTGSMLASTFVAALVISVGGHILARVFKTPVTMFVIPANLTLVPGAGMYRIVYYIIKSDSELSGYYFQQTLLAAGVIAAAIFIVNIVMGSFIMGINALKTNKKKLF